MDLEAQPLPVARFETARSECSGGIAMRTTPGDPQSIDIIFLDEHGADLSQATARKLERVFSSARSSGARSPVRSPSSPTRRG